MNPKKLISFLAVSAVLCAHVVAKASDMELQTNGARVTIGTDGGIQIESRGPVATNSPYQRHNPSYDQRNLGERNCHWTALNQQSSQTNKLENQSSLTYSFLSTLVCR